MSIFNSMKPDGGQKLRPFDLSHRDIFSVKSGVLNVNLVQHTLPESKYEVNHAQITRVDPIQSAPFARMSENYEYYFVPYSQIFHDFERLYYERGDAQRNYDGSAIGSNIEVSQYVPTFSYSRVMEKLAEFYVASRLYLYAQSQDERYMTVTKKYLYGDFAKYNVNSWVLPFDVHGEICVDEMIKLFDNLGYGNLYPLFSSLFDAFFDVTLMPYDNVKTDVEVAVYNDDLLTRLKEQFGWNADQNDFAVYDSIAQSIVSDFSLSYVTTAEGSDVKPLYQRRSGTYVSKFQQLVQIYVNYLVNGLSGVYSLFKDRVTALESYQPNVFALAAYVKVFSDIYRNTQYDLDNYALLFNYDYVTDPETAAVDFQKIILSLVPRFRQYKKDIFTGTFPNAQFGSVAVSSLNNPTDILVNNPPAHVNGYISLFAASNLHDGKVIQRNTDVNAPLSEANTHVASFDVNSGVSALAIRQALSLQRYKERILRAGNRLTALQNAVFGDRSRFIEDAYVQFIGAEHNNIDFNSVAATSDAGLSEVGQLSANGVGTHVGKAFEFHSHDFGMLIGIYYILPESEYESYMIDPQNTKSETNDYYKPDFMNLGLSPVWNYNFNFLAHNTSVGDRVLGYLANYWEYKTNVDKVHGNFYGTLPVGNGVAEQPYLPFLATALTRSRGQNANYVTPRSAVDMLRGTSLGVLYANPHDIDSIFYVNSDFTMNTDQFKCNCNHDIKALLPMSVVGLPEY